MMILGVILGAPNDLAKGDLIVTDDIRDMMARIENGAHLCGSYHRYAEDTGQDIIYTDLVVDINGGKTYRSHSIQDTDAFFSAVNFEGSMVVSNQSKYESVGWWFC